MEKVAEFSAGGVICKIDELGQTKVLLIRVRKQSYELPKGHIEEGESESQAVKRECIEEVGIESDFELIKEVGRICYSFISGEKEINKNVVYFKFLTSEEFIYKKPKNTREVIWVSHSELSKIEIVNEELRPIIEQAFNSK